MDNAKIAEKIYEIEHAGYKSMKEGKTYWDISEDIRLYKSDDLLSWQLWRRRDPSSRRRFVKIVPMLDCSKENICKILEAQSWTCM